MHVILISQLPFQWLSIYELIQISPEHISQALAYGGDECCVEGVLGEPEEDAGLPDARVADEEQLEEVVVRLSHGE